MKSALMNAVAAVKARLRGKPELATQLLDRAWLRIGRMPLGGVEILPLVAAVEANDPDVGDLVAAVRDLVQQADLS